MERKLEDFFLKNNCTEVEQTILIDKLELIRLENLLESFCVKAYYMIKNKYIWNEN